MKLGWSVGELVSTFVSDFPTNFFPPLSRFWTFLFGPPPPPGPINKYFRCDTCGCSQWRCWSSRSSGMWRRVVGYVILDVWNNHNSLIFTVKLHRKRVTVDTLTLKWIFYDPSKWTARGSNPGRGEILRTCPDQPWGPPRLLYNGHRVSFPRLKWPGRDADHPPPTDAEDN